MGKCGSAPKLWEQSPGATTRPLSGYQRREPEKTVLHQVVAENLETFLRELALERRKLPRYVEEELRRYLPCGMISEGFVRVKCRDCDDELLVAFSCKGRGFCPSCCARRMHDTAFHLVDHVLPEAPYRQYVLSYPFPVRLALARNWGAAASSRRIFLEEVFRFQRRKARRAGATSPKTGAISFTQRFGSKLNAHLHHHAVLPDGAFSSLDDGAVCFFRIAAPTLEELERILARVIRRTTRMLLSRGLLEEPDPEDALAHMQAESLQAGLPWRLENQRSSSRLAVQLDGYSIEAGTCIHENDRLGLLHLCRYGLRPPFSQERLRLRDDGRIELELRRPAHDGTSVVSFTPHQFLRRLAAIVPPPRAHLTGYHGVFAARSRLRQAVAPAPREPAGPPCPHPLPEKKERTDRTPWAHLLRRVFDRQTNCWSHC